MNTTNKKRCNKIQQQTNLDDLYELSRLVSNQLYFLATEIKNLSILNLPKETGCHISKFNDAATDLRNHIDNLCAELVDKNEKSTEKPDNYNNDHLKQLNRSCTEIENLIEKEVDHITSYMHNKMNEYSDPMIDFDIEASVAFVLREDDPEYLKSSDNYLSSRHIDISMLKHDDLRDWRTTFTPEALSTEPLSKLLYDLTNYNLGPHARKISYADCKRIGSIQVSITVQQQYNFDVTTCDWNSSWGD